MSDELRHVPFLEQQDLFASGEDGYARYRIPALAITKNGTILAFCEARKYTGADTDQIDLFVRRSFDGGKTFSPRELVASEEDWVCGNPAPVVDSSTGIIRLLFCKNRIDGNEGMIIEGKAPRTVWITSSNDDGATWSSPEEITSSVKRPDWSWYATGPGHGIQLASGRLVVACDHIVQRDGSRERDPYHSHLIFSDDGGASWQIGGIIDDGTNESTPLQTIDGPIYVNCRNRDRLADGGNYRAVAWSADDGMTFSPIVHDAALPEPVCHASVCRLTDARGNDQNRVLFSNPAGIVDGIRARRELTIRLSTDECRTWPVSRVLHAGPAAYSDLCVTHEGVACCFYERGQDGEAENSPYGRLTFARFNLAWLTQGEGRF